MQHVLSSVFPVTLSTYMYETYFRVMNAVFITKDTSENYKNLTSELPYARHYKPRLVFFFTQFSIQLRLILQTIYVLKTEILHFLSQKSAAYKRERLQIESGL